MTGEMASCDNGIIADIVARMEQFFATRKTYVPLLKSIKYKYLNFSGNEIAIINNYSQIFYKCTPKRAVLVKWILDETEKIFDKNGTSIILLEDLYNFMCNRFGTSFNRRNFWKLFDKDYKLVYEEFLPLKEKFLNEYDKSCNKNKRNASRFSNDIKTSKNIKKMINSVFGEEVFDINRTDQVDDESELSFEEIEIKNKILRAKEDLGNEICIKLLKNTNASLCFLELLSPYAKLAAENERIKQQLKEAIDNVNEILLSARLEPLLLAYSKDDEAKESTLQLLKNNRIVYVKELPNLLSALIDNKVASPLITFIKWLNDDKVLAIQNEFKQIFKTERDEGIIKMRATGATLEAVGKEYGITRERVRQIERKVFDKFNSFMSRIRPHYVLQAFAQSYVLLTVEEIRNHLGILANVFIYCLKECNDKATMWSNELKGFIIGNGTWYKQLSDYIGTLPDMFEVSDLDIYISNALGLLAIEVDHNLVGELILAKYNLTGNFYSKRKIGKRDVYLAVLERYYPYGIKLFDNFEMMRFRNYVKDLFGDIQLPENDRAICARIADITVLCDRGKYILPNRISLDDETLNKIYQFTVDNERNVIMFVELFERSKPNCWKKQA